MLSRALWQCVVSTDKVRHGSTALTIPAPTSLRSISCYNMLLSLITINALAASALARRATASPCSSGGSNQQHLDALRPQAAQDRARFKSDLHKSIDDLAEVISSPEFYLCTAVCLVD